MTTPVKITNLMNGGYSFQWGNYPLVILTPPKRVSNEPILDSNDNASPLSTSLPETSSGLTNGHSSGSVLLKEETPTKIRARLKGKNLQERIFVKKPAMPVAKSSVNPSNRDSPTTGRWTPASTASKIANRWITFPEAHGSNWGDVETERDVKPDVNQLKRHLSSSQPSTSSPSIGRRPSLASLQKKMPNLLKSFAPEAPNACKALVSVTSGMATDNVFLRKYDPIKLLGRLRTQLQSPINEKKVSPKKLFICDSFPSPTKLQNVKVEPNMTKSLGRKTSENFVTRPGGYIMVPKKPPFKKYSGRIRKKTLRYRCGHDISQERLRLLAALHLKRAIAKSRDGVRVPSDKPSVTKFTLKAKRRLTYENTKQKLVQNHNLYNGGYARTKKANDHECDSLMCSRDTHINRYVKLPSPVIRRPTQFVVDESASLMHSINLLRHKRELQDRLETMDSEGIVYKLDPTPEIADPLDESARLSSRGVNLNINEVRKIISEQLMVCMAHAGFNYCKLRPLEVLTQCVSDFLSQTADRLKDVMEQELVESEHGFSDPMDRILTELGLGGVRGAADGYRLDVLDYSKRMEDQCQTFRRQYAIKVRSTVGLTNSTSSSTDSTSTSGFTGNSSRSVATISTSNTGVNSTANTPSTIPMSPGNSVLAEILSSQEEHQTKTRIPQQLAAVQANGMDKQSIGVPPPNVVIGPNTMFNNTPQHTQLVLQTLNSLQSPPVKTLQPQLTQLLQRPVNASPLIGSKKPTPYSHTQTGHIAPHQHVGQYQTSPSPQMSAPATPSPLGHQEGGISNDLNNLINSNSSKIRGSPVSSIVEHQPASHYASDVSLKSSKNKTLTLIRTPTKPGGIIVNSEQLRHFMTSNSPASNNVVDMYSDLTSHGSPMAHQLQQQSINNVISINLGGMANMDIDNCQISGEIQEETVTMHAGESNFPPTIKLKEVSSQRNLLRLNFEQAPSNGGDSTVLLSSSPATQADSMDADFIPVQFF